jgi:RNA polymerase sigma-70 factor (ECF subfamily)
MTDLAAVDRGIHSTAPSATGELEVRLEEHRVELTAYSYRMLGSGFEAEDAVQETLVRAWRGHEHFEGRSALRSWLYRIATNVCLDMLKGRQRRARPIDLGPMQTTDTAVLGEPLLEATWIQPVPDSRILSAQADPAEAVVLRESVHLAFIAVLQFLPPRQRAVLILREVLQWRAAEVAELLDTSVAAVNSSLQRARATLAEHRASPPGASADSAPTVSHPQQSMADAERTLVARYVDAFGRYDIEALVRLLHEDATMSMPPYNLWIQGPVEIGRWMLGPGAECRGSRLIPTQANGSAAFGQYRASGPGGGHQAWSLQVLEISAGRVTGINAFLDTELLFPLFGLPAQLDPDAGGAAN